MKEFHFTEEDMQNIYKNAARINHDTKIIICLQCEGEGSVFKDGEIDHDSCEWEYESKRCPKCFGSGRLVEKTTIETSAYFPGKRKKELAGESFGNRNNIS